MLPAKGHYSIQLNYFPDSSGIPKRAEAYFDLDGTEEKLELTVQLLHDMDHAGTYHDDHNIFLNKYYGNSCHVVLKRLWNPKAQFDAGEALLPDYEWTNTGDSMLYGAHWQYSSHTSQAWARKWNIAFVQLQKNIDGKWESIRCTTTRVDANLKKGDTGKTLKDIPYSCDNKNFDTHTRYRAVIQYLINDAILRTGDTATNEANYYEPHIYEVADEFTLSGK